MRGKVCFCLADVLALGITPAYAGKSPAEHVDSRYCRDHPRMCGENQHGRGSTLPVCGSPPHVRGKATASCQFWDCQRITPACAGKRSAGDMYRTTSRDHPRMCGEKRKVGCIFMTLPGSPPHVRGKALPWSGKRSATVGSPPHVRGKVKQSTDPTRKERITPACAGKSDHSGRQHGKFQDYPRTCGEKSSPALSGMSV